MRHVRAVGWSIPLIAVTALLMVSLSVPARAAPAPPPVPFSAPAGSPAVPLMARRGFAGEAARAAAPPGNFPFQTASSSDGHIVVHFYNQYASFGADFIAQAQRALQEQVVPKLGFSLTQRVDIYYYNSRADFLSGAQPNSPAITGAYSTYLPFVIYMPVSYTPADTFATLAHELTHITFHQHVDAGHLVNDYDLFPVWFEEGQAASDEPSNSEAYAVYEDGLVRNIRYGGSYIDIFSQFVWTYPQDVNTDNLAYAESRSFINYLYATYGATRYHQFVSDAENGNLLYAAEMNFGADLQTLQSKWEQSLGLPGFKHDAGSLPQVATAVPFTTGSLPAHASSTRPYPAAGAMDVLVQALAQAGLALLIVLAALGAGAWWIRRQRAFARAHELAPPMPSYSFQPGYLPPPPAYQLGPTGAPQPATRPVTYAETLAPLPPLPSIKIPGDLTWLQRIALALAVPVALAAGVAWALVDPSLSWRNAALAAGAAALALAAVAGVLGWRARRQGVLPLGYLVTCGVLVVAALTAGLGDARAAGMAQGQAYERDSAYALAAQTFAAAGAPAQDQARVQGEWAEAAYERSDYADAATHFRAAIALAPGSDEALQDADRILKVITDWNNGLIGAQRFDDATRVVAAQLAFAGCDAACKTTLQNAGATDYLQWIQYLCAHKQAAQVLTEITALSTAYPGNAMAKSAQRALSVRSQGLAGAWSAAKAGDPVAMDLVAELVAAGTTDPLQLALASEASQPVTGVIDQVDRYKPDVHIYFIAFKSDAAARAFGQSIRASAYQDTSLFKVVAVTDANGKVTAWLPAGYTYLPLWEAQAKGSDDRYFFYSLNTITVKPFTPNAPAVAISY